MQKFTIEGLFNCGLADVSHLEKLINEYEVDINEVIDYVKELANDNDDKDYMININNYYYAFYRLLANAMADSLGNKQYKGRPDEKNRDFILGWGIDSIKTNCMDSCFDNEKMQELQQEYLKSLTK